MEYEGKPQTFSEAFRGKHDALIKSMRVTCRLRNILRDKGLLTGSDVDEIQACSTEDDRVDKLLCILERGDNALFTAFIDALIKDGQQYVIRDHFYTSMSSSQHINMQSDPTMKYIDVPGHSKPQPVRSIGYWIVMQNKVYDGSVSFVKPWLEYLNGFGSLVTSDNYWLGLENVYQLTKTLNYKLRIEIQRNTGPTWYWVEYSSFSLGSETTKYRLNVAGYSGTATDAFIGSDPYFANGKAFSTYDQDNDRCSNCNCATLSGSYGWWYGWCSVSNLNTHGVAGWTRSINRNGGIDWDVVSSRMLIGPK